MIPAALLLLCLALHAAIFGPADWIEILSFAAAVFIIPAALSLALGPRGPSPHIKRDP